MRKLIIFIFLVLNVCLIYAGNNFKVTSGKSVFNVSGSSAYFEIDFSNTILLNYHESPQRFTTFCGEKLDERINLVKETFTLSYNLDSKKMKFVDKADAKYLVKMVVNEIKEKDGSWGRHYYQMNADIVIVDVSTGATVCTISCKGEGKDDYVVDDRLGKLFESVGKGFARIK